MEQNSSTNQSNANDGGARSGRRVARYAFWWLVAAVSIYAVGLLALSANGVHLIRGI